MSAIHPSKPCSVLAAYADVAVHMMGMPSLVTAPVLLSFHVESVQASLCCDPLCCALLLPYCLCCTVQELLDTPNEKSPAQSDAFQSFTANLAEYRRKVRKQALQFPPPS